MDAKGEKGQQKQDAGLCAQPAQRTAPPGVSAPAPAGRPDAGRAQDGQLVEDGYGHGV